MNKWITYTGSGILAFFVLNEVSSRYFDAVGTHKQGIELAQQQAQTLLEQRDALIRDTALAAQAEAGAPALWTATSEDAPIGLVQNTIVDMANEAGAVLMSLSANEPQLIGSIDVIQLTLEVEADMAEWQDLLARVHQSTPTILPVSAELRRLNRTDPDAAYPETLLRLTLDFPYVAQGVSQ